MNDFTGVKQEIGFPSTTQIVFLLSGRLGWLENFVCYGPAIFNSRYPGGANTLISEINAMP